MRNAPPIEQELKAKLERDCIALCEALGYDFNTVELAMRDDTLYAIDFTNPAPDADAARGCPRGDMDMVWCEHCGFIANMAFDERLMEYEGRYENALHFSPLFRQYADGRRTEGVDT